MIWKFHSIFRKKQLFWKLTPPCTSIPIRVEVGKHDFFFCADLHLSFLVKSYFKIWPLLKHNCAVQVCNVMKLQARTFTKHPKERVHKALKEGVYETPM